MGSKRESPGCAIAISPIADECYEHQPSLRQICHYNGRHTVIIQQRLLRQAVDKQS